MGMLISDAGADYGCVLTGVHRSMEILQNEPSASREASVNLIKNLVRHGLERGQGWEEVLMLPSIAGAAGFADVKTDVFGSDRVSSTRHEFSKVCMAALSGIAEMHKKMDGGSGYWASDEAAKLQEAAAQELSSGKIYLRANLSVVYAQRPH